LVSTCRTYPTAPPLGLQAPFADRSVPAVCFPHGASPVERRTLIASVGSRLRKASR
jgi:hypothetical protein